MREPKFQVTAADVVQGLNLLLLGAPFRLKPSSPSEKSGKLAHKFWARRILVTSVATHSVKCRPLCAACC